MPYAKRIVLGLCLAAALPCTGQVLARPGWAGSGVAPESWWRRAIFYRIDPSRFQDATGTGTGDLQGIIGRLDYLQSLGIDALLLDSRAHPDGLEDLVREASQRHLRVVLAIDRATAGGSRTTLLASVHDWLSAGVAGLWLHANTTGAAPDTGYAGLVSSLRQMLQSLPGDRVLLTDPVPNSPNNAPPPLARRRGRGPSSAPPPVRVGQLTAAAALPVASGGVVQLRSALSAASLGTNPEANTLLQFAADPPTASPDAAADAAILLASRGAAIFDFGDEIGLDLYPPAPSAAPDTHAGLPVMQWTPSNHTPAPVDRSGTTKAPSAETEFGAYHPYQPPPRNLTASTPGSTRVTVDANIPPAPPDPDTLPGFTVGILPAPPTDGPKRNVVTEDRDPGSLLNAYRALIGLHHDNATLRNGTQYLINRDADGALVWIRRAPAGSRTVANVVIAANLTDKPILLALDPDIEALGMRPGALRPLFVYAGVTLTGETTGHLSLPPHAVFLGEIYHAGSLADPVAHERPTRRSRHRVRR